MSLYPPFNFARAYGNIATLTSSYFDLQTKNWQKASEFTWDDWDSPMEEVTEFFAFSIPSVAHMVQLMLIDIAILVMLIWYCDNINSSNRGISKPWYFCCTRQYYGCKRRRTGAYVEIELAGIGKDPVRDEKERVQTLEASGKIAQGLRIFGMTYVYESRCWGCKVKRDVHAVNDVFLEWEQNQVTTILGHNGAGKSTLINTLIGLLHPTQGTAFFNDLDITYDLDTIRTLVGYCPQHNILWDELSAREHYILFSIMRGVSKDTIKSTIDQALDSIEMLDFADFQAGTYSGGMKRRLSVILASIGSPKVIFLDEPTTGMDPICRRSVWKLIQNIKQNKVVILTTHSMEEADVLSDRIVVMVDGQFQCMGTSLYLKNNFGDGYSIALTTSHNTQVKDIIANIIPSSVLTSESGSSLVFSIPKTEMEDLGRFFSVMEGNEIQEDLSVLPQLVDDWGLSHTTLEEVFMKVTGKMNSLDVPNK